MPIADWLSYPPPLYINIGFGLRSLKSPRTESNGKIENLDSPRKVRNPLATLIIGRTSGLTGQDISFWDQESS